MRYIAKGAPPPRFAHWRAGQPNPEYAALQSPEKDEVRAGLCAEQGHLCAYCQQRIAPVVGEMKVEHFVAQSVGPGRALDWRNLLGVCLGQSEPAAQDERLAASRDSYCDTARGNRPLHVDPTAGAHIEDLFRYEGGGNIRSDDAEAGEDIETLRLNHCLLVRARREVFDQLRRDLGQAQPWRTADIQRVLASWSTPNAKGQLPAFAGVAVFRLKRWLRRRAASGRS